MRQKSRLNLKMIAPAVYFAIVLLFVVFAVYMTACKDNTVYSARDIASYKMVENYSEKKIGDASAPVGVRKEYVWQIGDVDNNESCLMFYIVHSYAEVRFDDELIYSLTAGENTRVGDSPSSNWVVVPLYESDVGRTATVTVTPVYKSVQNREVMFRIGSRYAVFMQQLKTDLPQIILSSLCVVMGILLIIIQLCYIFNKRTSSLDMLYLGIFSLLVGIWRITDTRFSPIMFENHTAALGYITLSAFFIMPVSMLLFADGRYPIKFHRLVRLVALGNCVVELAALLCQVAGIADLRETLTVCHVTMIVDVLVLAFVSFTNAHKVAKKNNYSILVLLLVSGGILDFLYYYIKDTSSGIIFTTVAFLIYTLYLLAESILNINKKAYVDVKTELYNKTRWDEYIQKKIPASEPIGVMMLDLNGLKHINDTYGHKAGDKMIVKFSQILRDTFASGEFICRWGGDEFAVIVRNADREKLENYCFAVHEAAENYNSTGAKLPIYFACGYVLSTEFPDIARSELLTKADARMYRDKQAWYDENAGAHGNAF